MLNILSRYNRAQLLCRMNLVPERRYIAGVFLYLILLAKKVDVCPLSGKTLLFGLFIESF